MLCDIVIIQCAIGEYYANQLLAISERCGQMSIRRCNRMVTSKYEAAMIFSVKAGDEAVTALNETHTYFSTNRLHRYLSLFPFNLQIY